MRARPRRSGANLENRMMSFADRVRSLLLFVVPAALVVAMLVASARVLADQPEEKTSAAKRAGAQPDAAAKGDTEEPDAKTDESAPAPQAAKVTPEAKTLIDQVDAAYSKLKSLELAGTFSRDVDAVGEEQKETRSFTAVFVAPNKFRHAMEDDMVVGSTGEKALAYLHGRNLYAQGDAPK